MGDLGWIPSWEDPPEEDLTTHSHILAWRILRDGGAWWTTVHGVPKSQTWLKIAKGICGNSGIAGSCRGFISSFLRNCYAVPYSGCINLRSQQQCKRVPFSPNPLQHLLLVDFFDDGHSDWCEVIPHCSFDLHFSNNEWCWAFFSCVYWPSICLLWRNVCLGLLPILWLGCIFFFLILSCMNCLYILEINPLSVASFVIIFSHPEGCLFILFMVSFVVKKLLCLFRYHLFIFVFFPLL